MARTTRSKAAAATTADAASEAVIPAPVTTTAATAMPKKKEPKNGSKTEPKDAPKTKGQQRHALRRKLYKKAKKHQEMETLHTTLKSADTSIGKKERSTLRAQIYQPWRLKAKTTSKKVSELEKLVKRQQEEIKELRKLAVGKIPKLQPPASPPAEAAEVDMEPDSSPAKIRDQLFADASRSHGEAEAAQEGTTVVEVEEIVKRPVGGDAGEPMEGVQQTTIFTSVEQDVEYPTLPSVEEATQVAEENGGAEGDETSGQQQQEPNGAKEGAGAAADLTPELAADTPTKSKGEVRDSSADSNAGTPRNVRRSPRKRTKRRSFAGHSYTG